MAKPFKPLTFRTAVKHIFTVISIGLDQTKQYWKHDKNGGQKHKVG